VFLQTKGADAQCGCCLPLLATTPSASSYGWPRCRDVRKQQVHESVTKGGQQPVDPCGRCRATTSGNFNGNLLISHRWDVVMRTATTAGGSAHLRHLRKAHCTARLSNCLAVYLVVLGNGCHHSKPLCTPCCIHSSEGSQLPAPGSGRSEDGAAIVASKRCFACRF